MAVKQFNSSTDLGKADLERARPHLGGLLDDGFDLERGNAKLLDGKSASVLDIALGQSFCVVEFRPIGGRAQQRIETFVFGLDGQLMKSFATEWGEKTAGGLKSTGRIEATAPYARAGLEIVREFVGKARSAAT